MVTSIERLMHTSSLTHPKKQPMAQPDHKQLMVQPMAQLHNKQPMKQPMQQPDHNEALPENNLSQVTTSIPKRDTKALVKLDL